MINPISGIIPHDYLLLTDTILEGQNLKERCAVELDPSLPPMGFRHTPGTTLVYFGAQLFEQLKQDVLLGKFFDCRMN